MKNFRLVAVDIFLALCVLVAGLAAWGGGALGQIMAVSIVGLGLIVSLLGRILKTLSSPIGAPVSGGAGGWRSHTSPDPVVEDEEPESRFTESLSAQHEKTSSNAGARDALSGSVIRE